MSENEKMELLKKRTMRRLSTMFLHGRGVSPSEIQISGKLFEEFDKMVVESFMELLDISLDYLIEQNQTAPKKMSRITPALAKRAINSDITEEVLRMITNRKLIISKMIRSENPNQKG